MFLLVLSIFIVLVFGEARLISGFSFCIKIFIKFVLILMKTKLVRQR